MKITLIYNGEGELADYLKNRELNINFIDIQNFNPLFGSDKSDGYILLQSEKESASLNLFLKYFNKEMEKKPIGIISYSNSLNSQKNFDKVFLRLLSLNAFPVRAKVRLIQTKSGIVENGDVKELLGEVKWWAKTLRNERINSKLNVSIKKTEKEELNEQNIENLEYFLNSAHLKN